jgi:hypothetical protein
MPEPGSYDMGTHIFAFCRAFQEHRLRVLENRVLRRIFRPERGEVTGGWRKLRNGELRNLYSSPSIIKMIKSRVRWAGYEARMVPPE